jgi:hypothetical protein
MRRSVFGRQVIGQRPEHQVHRPDLGFEHQAQAAKAVEHLLAHRLGGENIRVYFDL